MIVIKYGGHAMDDSQGHFATSVKELISAGEKCVIVHGGGPQIDAALKSANISSEFVGGFRVTTKEILAVATQVLNKEIQPKIIEQLERAGVNAVGVAGSEVLQAIKQKKLVDGSAVDLGYVGDVVGVDSAAIEKLLALGTVVVISPILGAADGSADTFNVNADLVTAAVAGALEADLALFLTDVPGIYRNWPDTDSLITEISAIELDSIKASFVAGMAPKVAACLAAVSAGAKQVRVIDGRSAQVFHDALLGHGGTLVRA